MDRRRARLPGAEELFGVRSAPAGPPPTDPDADTPDTPETPPRRDPQFVAAAAGIVAEEGEALAAARDRFTAAAGSISASAVAAPEPLEGGLLRWAATTCGARTVVEVGAAGGVTALWLLDALPDRGVLTSIEPDPHGHALAVEAVASVRASSRVRAIQGDAATVLPRLADAGYDLVVLQDDPSSYADLLGEARRILRPGGMLAARGVLRPGVGQAALTRLLHDLVEDPTFATTVLPVGSGLALARLAPDGT